MKFAQKLQQITQPKILEVIKNGHPKYNHMANKAIQVDQLSTKLKTEIESVKITAALYGFASLSSIQVGLSYAFFVMKGQLEYNKWYYKPCESEDYTVYINPQIISESDFKETQYEECPSTPFQIFKIQRSECIQISYQDFKFQEQRDQFDCFKARVFQHEMDHLNAIINESDYFKVSPRLQELQDANKFDEIERELKYLPDLEAKIDYNLKIMKNLGKNKQ